MLYVLRNTWALLLGMLLLMLGNGMQGSLLGIRGAIEGFSPLALSLITSGYFLGFLISSRVTPDLIRRVGHVRVFAAMASIISAAFILYAALPDVWVWGLLRIIVGAGFASVYIVAESWLNDSATNETRGQALSAYMIVQLGGIVAAQGLLNFGDPAGYGLFVLISVAVSLSFAPILLTVSPVPVHDATEPMTLRELFEASPLGCVGALLLGGVFSTMFGMTAIYGTEIGLSVAQISALVAAIYTGGMVLQYPIGWISDRMDRRLLILIVTAIGAAASLAAILIGASSTALLIIAFLVGGVANPLYALLIAHTNDFLDYEDMAAASGGLVFLNGVGAIGGPLVVGVAIESLGAWSYWGMICLLLGGVSAYSAYRMTVRPTVAVDETGAYAPVLPQATVVAVEAATEYAIDAAEAEAEEAAGADAAASA
ncbi:MAG: MFS transporter [Pseudomonadota bacterium]